jgi:DNA repair exonuclease SbcCD ATPase subunit
MTSNIKNIFRLKPVSADKEESPLQVVDTDNNAESTEETRKRTYHESGYRDSSRNNGNHTALSICLDAIYSKFQNEEKELADKQNKLKEPYINEQKNKETEIKGLTVSLDNKEDQIKEVQQNIETVQNKIETLKFEINDIPRNPKLITSKPAKVLLQSFGLDCYF